MKFGWGEDMAQTLHRLTVKQVDATAPGKSVSDGGGLLYRSTGKGQGKWAFKFTSPDQDFRAAQKAKGSKSIQRERGLGAYPAVTLAQAREKASAVRDVLAKGLDPIEAERQAEDYARLRADNLRRDEEERALTFGRYADECFLPVVLPGFSNAAHIQQWQATFHTHAASLRDKPLASITREDVLAVLRPIWTTKNETASRSRQRIERLFAHAIQNGKFRGDNPASWRQFDATLPPRRKAPRHHPAIPHDKIANFVAAIRAKQHVSMAALMLEWITLAACRTGEARFAVWGEIDLERGLWAIPAGRMKMRRDHVVPITGRMVEILEVVKSRHPRTLDGDTPRADDLVFVNGKGKALSEMAGMMLIRGLDEFGGYTAHGLRATFKGWAATETEFPRELIEEQLAHQLGTVERAYMRQSAHERRRPMMEAWASVCGGQDPADGGTGIVVPLRPVSTGGRRE